MMSILAVIVMLALGITSIAMLHMLAVKVTLALGIRSIAR